MHEALAQPMNVAQISALAGRFDYNADVPLKNWIRAATTLQKEASLYERDGNDQQAYLLLLRHADLVIGSLTKHPQAKSAEYKPSLVAAKKDVQRNLQTLEVLRPRINTRYDRYQQAVKLRDSVLASQKAARDEEDFPERLEDPALDGSNETVDVFENQDLAVSLAKNDLHRRQIARQGLSTPNNPKVEYFNGSYSNRQSPATTPGGTELYRETITRATVGSPARSLKEYFPELPSKDDTTVTDDLSNDMQRLRLKLDETDPITRQRTISSASRKSESSHALAYPSLATSIPTSNQHLTPNRLSLPDQPPLRPRKISLLSQTAPPIPAKVSHTSSPRPSTPPAVSSSKVTFKPSAYLENGNPLRTIILPSDLRHKFTDIALPNTRLNLETCGILCGTLISNALYITRLVIPEQTSTSDTCEMINEAAFFDYVDGQDLMVLGWIHTHPTQTCFMSSRDLHTHAGYQVMMPEAIAIVVAPAKDDVGVFRLTDPPGMQAILQCSQSGLFHPHSVQNIYTGALKPGHCFEARGIPFEIHDMRK